MRAIETGLGKVEGVTSARVNLSMRRVRVLYDPATGSVEAVLGRLGELGYEARPYDASAMAEVDRDSAGHDLLVRLAVAGFAAMNVMLLSVSVWAGAEAATRDLLHWISALIALPAIAFSGMPFFRSALTALAARPPAGRAQRSVPPGAGIVAASRIRPDSGRRTAPPPRNCRPRCWCR